MTDGSSPRHFHSLVCEQAGQNPDRIALLAPNRDPWTYRELALRSQAMIAQLQRLGLQPSDRVAIVSRNSMECVAAHLAVTAVCTSAPLNPAYREPEFEFYFSDLKVKAIVLAAGQSPAAQAVAERTGVSVIPMEAGGIAEQVAAAPESWQPDATAMVLHTSGTTAQPKIVPLTHANLWAATAGIRRTLELTAGDRCLNVMPIFHIHGLSAVLASLMAGASVVCPNEFSGPEFFDWVREFAPTWYTGSPAIHSAVLEWSGKKAVQPPVHSFRFLRSASAGMPPGLIEEIERTFQIPFIEAYGMTETAPLIASNPLPPGQRKVGSVGLPTGCETAILNEDGTRAAPGETGEIVVRGPNVMPAYENDAEANQRHFTDGWFRTGDLGQMDSAGYLYVVGRIKEIINRGGEKVAPREVEVVLAAHPAVASTVVFPVPHPRLGEEVVALIVLKSGASATARELQEFAAPRLADFKVPRHIEFATALPVTGGGKLKRGDLAHQLSLTALFGAPAVVATENGQPTTPQEEVIAAIWEEVLRAKDFGIHDDFFALGGDSVSAALALVRCNEALGADLSFLDFFEHPTVARRAARVSETGESGAFAVPPVEPIPDGQTPPLSIGQEALWFLDLYDPGNGAHNVYRAIRLEGPLDQRALLAGVAELIQRHDSLRTTFPDRDGQPQRRISPYLRLNIPVTDLRQIPAADREGKALTLIEVEAGLPFNLSEGPLMRARLLRLDDDVHILAMTMHHIVMEAWSLGILFSELEVIYEALLQKRQSPLPPPPLRHADYAWWQRQQLQGPRLELLTAYWKGRLAGAPPCLNLPFDFERPARLKYKGARQRFRYEGDLAQRLKTVGRAENATLYMTLLAGFEILLMSYSGQDDIVVGSPISGRDRPELEQMVGFFSNTLVMRTGLAGDPALREVIGRTRSTVLDAHLHHQLPFASVVAAVGAPRITNQNPLFQVNFRLRNIPPSHPALHGLTVSQVDMHNRLSKFDLAFELWEAPSGLEGFTEYSTELFREGTITGIVNRFQTVLETLASSPDMKLSGLFQTIATPQDAAGCSQAGSR